MRTLATRLVFPVLVGSSVLATWWGFSRGWSAPVVLNVVTNVFFVLVLLLELVLPHREDWRRSDGQVLHDLGHTYLGTGLGAALGVYTLGAAIPPLQRALWGETTWWPAHWPLAAQVLVIYLVADLGRYWQHRLHHMVPFLWRFHALHHSVARMSVWKTSRSHFVERFLQQVFMFGLLQLAGAPLEVLAWYIIPNSVIGLLDHSNVQVDLGVFERVIMGPSAHRLHHSAAREDIDTNFGSALVLWDVVFRTFRDPTRVPAPAAVGIIDDPVPRDFVGQYVSPFAWARYEARAAAARAGQR